LEGERGGERNACRDVVGKPEEKRRPGRTWNKFEDNITVGVKGIG
jgi:hypothetical protein